VPLSYLVAKALMHFGERGWMKKCAPSTAEGCHI